MLFATKTTKIDISVCEIRLQTGRIEETQVIPKALRSGLIIALGTLISLLL
jgi:hypothetical protein